VGVLDWLLKKIRRVRKAKFQSSEWFLLHDNAPSHNFVKKFLANRNVAVLHHPPNSPDLSPADYFLFPKLKFSLKGRHFQTVEEIQCAVTRGLNNIQCAVTRGLNNIQCAVTRGLNNIQCAVTRGLNNNQCAVTRELNNSSKTASLEGVKKLKDRANKCIDHGGMYFEE